MVDIQDIFNKKIKPVNFERTINLFGATTIGVGALLGAGIYVLIGTAANAAGPSVVLSYILCGVLAFVTTLMYAELSRVIPRSGGGYTYAYDILGSIGGFTTGWFLALGSIFASGLYAIGFAEYAISLTGETMPFYLVRTVAIGITIFIGLLGLRKTGQHKFNIQNWIVWGNVAILVLLVIASSFHLNPENLKPAFPHQFHGTIAAISLIYVSFFGYQLIANNADEIINPEKNIPKAMKFSMLISIVIYGMVAIAAVMSVSWKELGESHAPLVLLADKSFGGNGWLIISVGGILASLGALSSTIISQSRQTYAMGKDRFFPDMMGKLDEKTKQPKIALIAAIVLVVLVLLFFDLEFIAKATNFCLLVSLLPISLALRKLYKKNPALKPKAKWKHFLPQATLIINLGLLFTLDIVSLAFGQQLLLIGAIIYFFYSRKREKRAQEGLNIILKEERQFSFFTQNKILVPMSNPVTQNALLMLSNTLLAKKGGEIVVLAVKDVPSDMNFYTALKGADETLEVIKRSIDLAKNLNISIKPIIRASHKVSKGIVNVAQEENTDLIIMGFQKKPVGDKSSILSQVLSNTFTDTIVLNLKTNVEDFSPQKIGLYIKDTKHLSLMLMCATAVAEKRKSRIVIIGFLPEGYSKKQKRKADKLMVESLQNLNTSALYDVSLKLSDNPQQELVSMSKDLDALILGINRGSKGKSIEESPSFQIAQQVECTVVLVKSVTRIRKFTQRL
jgi:APA family basic amino acid/polyamine antiporter